MADLFIRLLRWFAILPAILLSWYASIIVGMTVLAFAESFCGAEQMVSGICVAPWFRWVESGIFLFSAGLAAALIVVSAALVAPAHRTRVAVIVYLAGCLLAAYLGWSAAALKEFAAAVVVGFIALVAIVRWERNEERRLHDV